VVFGVFDLASMRFGKSTEHESFLRKRFLSKLGKKLIFGGQE